MMDRKLVALMLVGAAVAVLLISFVLYQYSSGSARAAEILSTSKAAVEDLESLHAEAYFFSSLETHSFTEDSKYWFHLDLLRTTDEGRKMKVSFEDVDYSCSDPQRNEAYERLKASLRDAWILDTAGAFYVYSPMVLPEYVTRFTPQSGLLRYSYIPITDPLHLALLFERAENATYEGMERIEVGDRMIESHVVSYDFSYPTVRFAEHVHLRTWISAEDYIPLKSELHGTTTDDGAEITFVFGLTSYEKGVLRGAVELPEGIGIIQR